MIVGCTSAYTISSCHSFSCEFDLLGVGLLFSLWVLQVSSTNKSDLQDITAIVMKEEFVNRKRTDNTMTKRKETKGQTTIYKTIHGNKTVEKWPPQKTGDGFRCFWRISSSCITSGTRRVSLVANPVISIEWGEDREMLTSGTYPWSFVTLSKWCLEHLPLGSIVLVALLLAAIRYEGIPIGTTSSGTSDKLRDIHSMQVLLECRYI